MFDSGTRKKVCHRPPEGPGQQQWQHSESNAAVLGLSGTLLETLQDRLNMCMLAKLQLHHNAQSRRWL